MLESIHLQGAALDNNLVVKQWNQAPIDIINAPFQHVAPMIREMCMRNRTRNEEGCRKETVGLNEIDRIATQAKTRNMNEEDKMILDITRTGSTWSRTKAYWAGQLDDKLCTLCGEEDDSPDHFWCCKALESARKEADKVLAKLNPKAMPMSIKCGVAPAMVASTENAYWVIEGNEYLKEDQKKLCGFRGKRKVHQKFEKIIEDLKEEKACAARELIQTTWPKQRGVRQSQCR